MYHSLLYHGLFIIPWMLTPRRLLPFYMSKFFCFTLFIVILAYVSPRNFEDFFLRLALAPRIILHPPLARTKLHLLIIPASLTHFITFHPYPHQAKSVEMLPLFVLVMTYTPTPRDFTSAMLFAATTPETEIIRSVRLKSLSPPIGTFPPDSTGHTPPSIGTSTPNSTCVTNSKPHTMA